MKFRVQIVCNLFLLILFIPAVTFSFSEATLDEPGWQIQMEVETDQDRVTGTTASGIQAEITDQKEIAHDSGHQQKQEAHAKDRSHVEIKAQEIRLADQQTLAKLNADHFKSAEMKEHRAGSHGYSRTFWAIVTALIIFGIVVVIALVSKSLNRFKLRTKMYASFGSVLLLAAILGGGAYFNFINVKGLAHLEAAFLQLEVQSGNVKAAQNGFLLYGLENKKYGEKQIQFISDSLKSILKELDSVKENSFLLEEQVGEIPTLKKEIEEYGQKLGEVVDAFHEIEEGKLELDTVAGEFVEKLSTMAKHHEELLSEAEHLGTDLDEITKQTVIVEHLLTMEIHGLKLAHAEIEFLLDKNPIHIGTMEKELGLFKAYLVVAEHELEEPEELQQLEAIGSAIGEYEAVLKRIIKDEAIIKEDVGKMNSLMGEFFHRVEALSHETEVLADNTVKEAVFTIVMLIAVMLVAGVLLALLLTRMITTPILQSVSFAEAIASGDLTQGLAINQKDETGLLVEALSKMNGSLRQMMNDIKSGSNELSTSSGNLNTTANDMAKGSEETSNSANTVAAAAEEMSVNMSSVAAAAEQAATNVNIVAAAAEEMTSTIAEITQNTAKTNTMTTQAVDQASNASAKVDELGRAAQDISKVTETITEISEQTNLLALNATIEAARAGEAGKGFAVVANEIKELAKQTAEATLEIKSKIEGVQNSTQATVSEIADITSVIGEVNAMTSTIAAAIEEQSAATQEIASNVSQASQGIQEVTENVSESSVVARDISGEIAGIDQAASDLNTSSREVLSSSKQLNEFALGLRSMVEKFKV